MSDIRLLIGFLNLFFVNRRDKNDIIFISGNIPAVMFVNVKGMKEVVR